MKDKRMKYDLSYNIMQGGSNQEGYQRHPSEHYINKILSDIRKRSGKGNRDNTNSGGIKLAGISKLRNSVSKNNSENSGSSGNLQKKAKKEAEKKVSEKKAAQAAHEAKKIIEQVKKAQNIEIKKQDSKIKKGILSRKRNRIELMSLTEEEKGEVQEFIENIRNLTKVQITDNFCRIKKEGIQDNIVVQLFIPNFLKNLNDIHDFLIQSNNLEILQVNYYEFEARYREIFKVFYDLQLKYYRILYVQKDLGELSKFFSVKFKDLDDMIDDINENGFNFDIVKKLDEWIDTFKTRAKEKYENLDIDSLQEKYTLETTSDIEPILAEVLYKISLLGIKEELTSKTFTKIMGKISTNHSVDKVFNNIRQLMNILISDGNIKTFYEKYDIGYFTSEQKEEVKKLVLKLAEEIETLKLKYDEDIKHLLEEKDKEYLPLQKKIDDLNTSRENSNNSKKLENKNLIEEIVKEQKRIENKYNDLKNKLYDAYEKSQIILFNSLVVPLSKIHKEATQRFNNDKEILRRYFELKEELEQKLGIDLEQLEKSTVSEQAGGNRLKNPKNSSEGFIIPTGQRKEKRRKYRKKAKAEKAERIEKEKAEKAKREQNSVRMAANAPTILEKKGNNYKSVFNDWSAFNEIPQNQPEQPKPSQSFKNFEKQLQDITTKFKSNLNSLNTRKKQSSSVPETMAQKLKRQEQKRKANALAKASEEQKKTATETMAQRLKRQEQKRKANKEAQEAKNYEEILASVRRQANANAEQKKTARKTMAERLKELEQKITPTKTLSQKINEIHKNIMRNKEALEYLEITQRIPNSFKQAPNSFKQENRLRVNEELKRSIGNQLERMASENAKAVVVKTERDFLPIFIDAYIKFFYPLEFLLAEYKKIIMSYNELFTTALEIKDKLYFVMKIYNRLKSKDSSNFSCTFAYIAYHILHIKEIQDELQENHNSKKIQEIQNIFIEAFRDYCKNTSFSDDISTNVTSNFLKQKLTNLAETRVQGLLSADGKSLLTLRQPNANRANGANGANGTSGTSGTSGAVLLYSAEAAKAREQDNLKFKAQQSEKVAKEKEKLSENIIKLYTEIKKISNKSELTLQDLRNIKRIKQGLNTRLQDMNNNGVSRKIRNYLTELNINTKISNEQTRLIRLRISEIIQILDNANHLSNNSPIADVKRKLVELIKIKEKNTSILTENNNQRIDLLIKKLKNIISNSTSFETYPEKIEAYESLNKNTEDLDKLNDLLELAESILKIEGIPKDIKKKLKKDVELIKTRIDLAKRAPITLQLQNNSGKKSKKSKKPKKPNKTLNIAPNTDNNSPNISELLANQENARLRNQQNEARKALEASKEANIKRALQIHQNEEQKQSDKQQREQKRIESWIKKYKKYQILYDSFGKNKDDINKNKFDSEMKEFELYITRLYCIFINKKPLITEDFEFAKSEFKKIVDEIQATKKNEFIRELIEKLRKKGMNFLNIATDEQSADKRFIVWKKDREMNKMFNINKLFTEIKNKNSNNRELSLQELKNIKEMKKVLNKKLEGIGEVPEEIKNYFKKLNINTRILEEKRKMRELEIIEILKKANELSDNANKLSDIKETLGELRTIKESNKNILTSSNNEIIDNLIYKLDSIHKKQSIELKERKKPKKDKENQKTQIGNSAESYTDE